MRVVWIAALAGMMAGPATAAQQEVTDEQIEALSAWIVEAEVSSTEVRWASGGRGDIETVAWLAVDRVIKGEPVETLAVVLEGGQLGGDGNWVPDEARLLEGARYELTLAYDDRDRLRVLGGDIGAVPLGLLPCYSLTGADWTHNAHPVGEDFSLNVNTFNDGLVTDDVLEEAYLETLNIWNVEGEAGVYLPYGGQTNNAQYGGDSSVNVAMYANSTWGSTLAMAMYSWTGNGNLTDCDIEFYGSNGGGSIQWSFDLAGGASGNQMDFAIVAVHEIGHCLGLDHSGQSGAIMYPSASPGTGPAERHLHHDDISGLQAIYGPGSVLIVVDDAWFELAEGPDDGDAAIDPGEIVELHVVLRNQGSSMAGDVQGSVVGTHDGITPGTYGDTVGDMAPGSDSGSEADHLVFSLTTNGACSGSGTAAFHVEIDDAAGDQWTSESWDLDYQCEGGGGDDDGPLGPPGGLDLVEPDGCTCGLTSREAGCPVAMGVLLFGLAAFRIRRTC